MPFSDADAASPRGRIVAEIFELLGVALQSDDKEPDAAIIVSAVMGTDGFELQVDVAGTPSPEQIVKFLAMALQSVAAEAGIPLGVLEAPGDPSAN